MSSMAVLLFFAQRLAIGQHSPHVKVTYNSSIIYILVQPIQFLSNSLMYCLERKSALKDEAPSTTNHCQFKSHSYNWPRKKILTGWLQGLPTCGLTVDNCSNNLKVRCCWFQLSNMRFHCLSLHWYWMNKQTKNSPAPKYFTALPRDGVQ